MKMEELEVEGKTQTKSEYQGRDIENVREILFK